MTQDKKEEQGKEVKPANEDLPSQTDEDLHKEIKNANASGLGSLGRSDETIEKTKQESEGENKTQY